MRRESGPVNLMAASLTTEFSSSPQVLHSICLESLVQPWTFTFWSKLLSCADVAGGVSSYQLSRDKTEVNLGVHPCKKTLVTGTAQSSPLPWGRLAARPAGNGECEAVPGKPVAAACAKHKLLWQGGGEGRERHMGDHLAVRTESVPIRREDKYGSRRVEMGQDDRGCYSMKEHLVETHKCWLCVWWRNRRQLQKGRGRAACSSFLRHSSWRVAEQRRSAQHKELQMCSSTSLRKHLQNVRYCHSTLKVRIGEYYYKFRFFKNNFLLNKKITLNQLLLLLLCCP